MSESQVRTIAALKARIKVQLEQELVAKDAHIAHLHRELDDEEPWGDGDERAQAKAQEAGEQALEEAAVDRLYELEDPAGKTGDGTEFAGLLVRWMHASQNARWRSHSLYMGGLDARARAAVSGLDPRGARCFHHRREVHGWPVRCRRLLCLAHARRDYVARPGCS